MSNARQALVLHLAATNQPLLIELAAEAADELTTRLPELVRAAGVESIEMANGVRIVVNFAAVQVAHVDVVTVVGQLYGSPRREK